MKTFVITVWGQSEVDIYNTISHVRTLVHNNQLSGEGTLVRGFLEGFGKFNFKSLGEYEFVLPAELEELIKRTEASFKKSPIYREDTHDFEVRDLSEDERNDYEKRIPPIVRSSINPTNLIIFDITVSGTSRYVVEKFIMWIYRKISGGSLLLKPSRINMLPENINGFCSFKSYGKYQSTYDDSIIDCADDEDEDYFSGSDNNYESKDTYCSACQQDPCQCSDREKTSTVYDF